MADEEGEQLLTVDQVARRLQLHPATIRRWIESGRLRGSSLSGDRAGWRIRRSELEQLILGLHQPELPGVVEELKNWQRERSRATPPVKAARSLRPGARQWHRRPHDCDHRAAGPHSDR